MLPPLPVAAAPRLRQRARLAGLRRARQRRVRPPAGFRPAALAVADSRGESSGRGRWCSRPILPRPRRPAPLIEARLGSRGPRASATGVSCERFEPGRVRRSRAGSSRGPASSLRTLLIHEYRRLHLRDPLAARATVAGGLAGTQGGRALPLDLCAGVRGLRGASLGGRCAARRSAAARRSLHPRAASAASRRCSALSPFR